MDARWYGEGIEVLTSMKRQNLGLITGLDPPRPQQCGSCSAPTAPLNQPQKI